MSFESVTDVASLNQWMTDHNMRGYWMRGERLDEPRPFLWKWSDIEPVAMKAGQLLSIEEAFRRNIGLVNPRNGQGIMANVGLGLQVVMPGEVAPSHRHSASAIRFVIKGHPRAYTIAGGEPMPLEEGDLITNPHLTFHGHVNEGDQPVIWLDGLDIRFAHLAHEFREDLVNPDPVAHERIGYSRKIMGRVRPSWLKGEQVPPPFRYPWAETQSALNALKEGEAESDPCDGYLLTYRHPLTGGPTLPSVACEIQLLPPHFRGGAHRHNSTTAYHVFRGRGVTTVDGERFEWSKGDFLSVPPWAEHRHENPTSEDCILFSFTDWPAMQALGIYDIALGEW